MGRPYGFRGSCRWDLAGMVEDVFGHRGAEGREGNFRATRLVAPTGSDIGLEGCGSGGDGRGFFWPQRRGGQRG